MEISRHWRRKEQEYRLEGMDVNGEKQFRLPPVSVLPQDAKLAAVLAHIHETVSIDPRVEAELAEERWTEKQAGRTELGQLLHAFFYAIGYWQEMLTAASRKSILKVTTANRVQQKAA